MACILIRGGGDLATGAALRLHRAGFRVAIAELAQPLAVRRAVSLAEAVYEGEWTVEGMTGRRADSAQQAGRMAEGGIVPVLVAAEMASMAGLPFQVLVDARMIKRPPETDLSAAPLVIGLGPGFVAGIHCHAVVETRRGHTLGRVYWTGSAQPDTAQPGGDPQRVLRSPADGVIHARVEIGQHVEAQQTVAEVARVPLKSPFSGVVRGLIRPGLTVARGLKVGDVDASDLRERCYTVSDKALAV